MSKNIDHPDHYNWHPSGAECIEIAEEFTFNLGNVIKYVWRSGRKGDRLECLRKAAWYLNREIVRLENDIQQRETAVTGPLLDPITTAWGQIDTIPGEVS